MMDWNYRLIGKHIAIILVVKVMALAALKILFFSDPASVNSNSINEQLFKG